MKKFLLPFFLLVLVSCEQFETRKITSEELLSEESRELNWNQVDQYPAFSECREFVQVEAAKACFEKKVTGYFYARLEEKQPVVTDSFEDTLHLFLTVSERGVPTVDSIQIDSIIVYHLPDIREWLEQSVDSLPKIFPASKRGIPVATKFRMPIVVKAE